MIRIHPVILSGGSGSRLWPASRQDRPKQLLTLTSARSMLQETALRVRSSLAADLDFAGPMIVANQAHEAVISAQMTAIDVSPRFLVLEPEGRNTAPAIAVAALLAQRDDPSVVLLVMPADHHIADRAAFHAAVAAGAKAAEAGALVTFGIVPTGPETGFGYIARGEPYDGMDDVYAVSGFVEKPDAARAARFVAARDHYWNAGIFLFRCDVLLREMAAHCPSILAAARKALPHDGREGATVHLDADQFRQCPANSIDYAVMEKTDKACVVPVSMGWSDVGSWAALWEIAKRDDAGNVVDGPVVLSDVRNCYVRSNGRLIALVGVEDLVVVETADSILVLPRDRAQDVRSIVDRLKKLKPETL